jgi:CO dehydrogenase nickel-insertion accessory protein CooC1
MKIAFVGKGGSGKSSISWLAVKTLEAQDNHVLAIDADHNMDLTSNLGLDPEKTPFMHQTDKDFMEAVGLAENDRLVTVTTKETAALPTFSVNPKDSYTQSISSPVSAKIDLINIGLGSPDVLYTTKCAHALSGPLKFYLGMLDQGDSFVVIDSVAGTDMVNYGLYAGIDAVIGVVEPHRNSIKVFEQIYDVCRKSGIPCYAIVNKPAPNEFYFSFVDKHQQHILGEIPLDAGILNYNYASISESVRKSMSEVLDSVKKLPKRGNLASIYEFQHKVKGNI